MGADVKENYTLAYLMDYWLYMAHLRYKDLTVWDPFRDVRVGTVIHNYPKYKLYIGRDRQVWRKAK